MFCLQRIEWDGTRAHQVFHVDPGGVGTFCQRVGALIDHVVENLETEIGYADIIDIGEDEGDFGFDFIPILNNGVQFAADVAAWLLHL